MWTEVELKAHVDDPDAVLALLEARYGAGAQYIKEDIYYRLPGPDGKGVGRSGGGEPIEFRLRREDGRAVVTAKRKSLSGGIEVNAENEFTVDDPAAFEVFAGYLGAVVFSHKRKEGRSFTAGGATIELSNVMGLGWFVEIEELVDAGRPGEVERARERVAGLLAAIGVPAERIEPRYYTDMLAELDE